MKKIVLTLASAALVFAMVSCASNEAVEEDDLAAPDLSFMEVEEDTSIAYTSLNEAVTGNSCNSLAADTGVGVSIVVDKDLSKDPAKDVLGASLEVVEYLGEKCLRVTPNYNPEIRLAYWFDEPISLEEFKTITFDIAGYDGGYGAYNMALVYEEGKNPSSGEWAMSFYLSDIKADEWLSYSFDLVADEQWGQNFKSEKHIVGLQYWSGSKDALYIKNVGLKK